MKNLSVGHLCVRLILPFFTFIFFISTGCRKTESKDANLPVNTVLKVDAKDFKNYRIKFTKAISKALTNEPALREFIKTEALLKFDRDYDILYQKVKNHVFPDGKSFREKILKYYGNEEDFNKAELAQPLLTIFVPSLPMDSWSAEKWNTQSEVPLVLSGFVEDNNEVYCYDGDSVKMKIPDGAFPAVPIIALKDNERVAISKNGKSKVAVSSDQFAFSFIDESFDGSKKAPETKSYQLKYNNGDLSKGKHLSYTSGYPVHELPTALLFDVPQSQVEQFLIDGYDSGLEWQRDNIYYGLTSTVSSGKLRPQRQEAIRGITVLKGIEGWRKLSDQTRDNQDPLWVPLKNAKIIEGDWEFRFTIFINSTNGLGAATTKIFSVKPEDVFDIVWYKPFIDWQIKQVSPKVYDPREIIAIWDLASVSEGWRVNIDEVDPDESYTETFTQTVEHARNFEYSPVVNEIVKLGYKFGSSSKTSTTQTFSYTRQYSDDILGNYNLYFGDRVVLNYGRPMTNPGEPEPPVMVSFPLYKADYIAFNIRPTSTF